MLCVSSAARLVRQHHASAVHRQTTVDARTHQCAAAFVDPRRDVDPIEARRIVAGDSPLLIVNDRHFTQHSFIQILQAKIGHLISLAISSLAAFVLYNL